MKISHSIDPQHGKWNSFAWYSFCDIKCIALREENPIFHILLLFVMKQYIPFTFEYEQICISLGEIANDTDYLIFAVKTKTQNQCKLSLNFWNSIATRQVRDVLHVIK